ncbi:AAA family ATPase [bacterium]|nr:AAA family ATPase [bacterium]
MVESDLAHCGHANPDSARFCATCGRALSPRCAGCGATLPAAARFCSQCGQAVGAAETAGAAAGERRQLTVLFSDLVGSTELASRLDPEEYQELVGAYYTACGEAVRTRGGHLAQLLGDGVLAYFGYPLAHEDSARRAVLAALDAQRALAALAASCTARFGVAPVARVGIHTGVVIVAPVRAGERQATVALGDAMNVAARVQALAEPNTVVVTAATRHLVAEAFELDNLGCHALKGVPEPVELHRVRGVRDARSRRAAGAASRATPFVGRRHEVQLLRRRWAAARAGAGQVVLLVGEAGIGKSRLIAQFRDDPEVAAARWIEIAAASELAHTPFGMLRLFLDDELGWPAGWSAEARLDDLERRLRDGGIDPRAGRALGALLELPVEARYGHVLSTAEQERRRLIESLVGWLRGIGRGDPRLLVFEDLHWADPSTLETLGLLARQIAGEPVLLLLTARSDFTLPWPLAADDARLEVNRLSASEVRDIVAHVAADRDPVGAVIEALVERTDGVPLFAEELARAVFERHDDHAAAEGVPLTLHDSLLARLDRLGPAKEVAQIAAVIGRSFSHDLLARVAGLGAGELDAGLAALADAGLVRVRGAPPQATYQFTHALMRQAAYDSLLKRRRRELHATVAQTIAAGDEAPAELLAQHWTAAGDGVRATAAWAAAAEQVFARSAFREASIHFAHAIEALLLSPESPERAGRELELQLRLATALQYGKGFVVPETAAAMARARQLGERIGNAEQRFSTLLGIWGLSLSRGEIAAAGELAEQILAIAEAEGRPAMLAQACGTRAASRLHLCDLAGAIAAADRAMAIPSGDDGMVSVLSHGALLYSGIALALTGRADQARARCGQLLELGDAPGMRPFALVANLVVHTWLREVDAVLAFDAQLRRECEALQMPLFAAWGRIYGGWAQAMQGRCAAGIEDLRRGMAEHVGSGQRLGFTQYLGLLAEAQLAAGALDEGLAVIDDALGARATEERWHHAELQRLRGALRAARGDDVAVVEAAYREAIATARRDGTSLFERRAATALARLLAAQGRRDEARALLAPVHASFHEGFDIADHHAAARVLAAL